MVAIVISAGEVEVGRALGLVIYGTAHNLWPKLSAVLRLRTVTYMGNVYSPFAISGQIVE